MPDLTHIDEHGKARMVDVSGKEATRRVATAQAVITMLPETVHKICQNELAKGDALGVARIAGILAAKRVDELIPSLATGRSSSRPRRRHLLQQGSKWKP